MNSHSIVEISKSALYHNITSYKKILSPGTLLASVIKGNAYGHGLIEIGGLLNEHTDIDYVCTVSLSEALQLRTHGISKPILVLGIIDREIDQAIIHAIDLVVYDLAFAQRLSSAAQRVGKKASIHLKIDIGMCRLGTYHEQALPFVTACALLPNVHIQGILSHFASSEIEDLSFYNLQRERFLKLLDQLERNKIAIPFKHCANSGAFWSPESHFNFARLGISTYGLWSSAASKARMQTVWPEFSLRPVMEWKTWVMARKTIPQGSFIGYNGTYQTAASTETAVLPIGFYDGYDRRLSNQGVVKIREQFFPVRGRISMNCSIIDVTACPEIAVGDHVTLLGGNSLISADSIAAQCATNTYECVARVNPLIPRIIVT